MTPDDALPARNLTYSLIDQAQTRPQACALLLPDGALSYRQLDEAVWMSAHALHDQGIRAGDLLGLAFANELTLVLTLLGAIRLGATAFSIPRSCTPTQQRSLAAQAGIKALATDRPALFGSQLEGPVLRMDDRWVDVPDRANRPDLLAPTPDAPWLLMSGSGTTGEPKLIPLTHGQSAARARAETAALQLTSADRIASLSTFDFAASKCRLHEAFLVGAAISLLPWNSTDPIGHLRKQSLSVVCATVFHAEALLAHTRPGRGPALPGLRVLELTSSTVSAVLRQRVRGALCPNLHVLYGINEAGPVCIAYPPEVFNVAGTVGRPLPGVQVEIVDQQHQPVAQGAIGLIRMQSPGLVSGYCDNEQATRQNFSEGWFTPGDLGRFTPDGQLIYCGRADHMMIMNGINIYPAEIERVISAHPDVLDAAAMPVRHPVHQDVPVCAVTLQPGSQANELELLAWAREKLGAHGPRHVLIVNEIPRTQDGKLVRMVLNEQIRRRIRGAFPRP